MACRMSFRTGGRPRLRWSSSSLIVTWNEPAMGMATSTTTAPATLWGGCAFTVGQDVPGFSTNDFGQLAQYGSLLKVTYPELGGTTASIFNDFNQILPNKRCPAP